MRYLSHEIRTPLNSVYVGLTIMLTELRRLETQGQQSMHEQDHHSSLLETALDTHKSCQSAVEILDDMILYDRITNGFISLDKTLFNPLAHISDVVSPFRMQVTWMLTNNWMSLLKIKACVIGPRGGHRPAAGEQHPPAAGPAPLRRPGQGRTSGPQLAVQCAQVHQPQRNSSRRPIR